MINTKEIVPVQKTDLLTLFEQFSKSPTFLLKHWLVLPEPTQ